MTNNDFYNTDAIFFIFVLLPEHVFISDSQHKRKPYSTMAWNCYDLFKIVILPQPCSMDLADINTWLQLRDANCIPPKHGALLLSRPRRIKMSIIDTGNGFLTVSAMSVPGLMLT